MYQWKPEKTSEMLLFFIFIVLLRPTQANSGCSGRDCLSNDLCKDEDSRVGVCLDSESCGRKGGQFSGFCRHSSDVCCITEYKCGAVTSDLVSYFQNHEYPGLVESGTLCSHIIQINPGICFVDLTLHSFSVGDRDLGAVCAHDWFTIIGSSDGRPAPLVCGDLNGYAFVVPVVSGQNLILSAGLQTRGGRWNIEVIQRPCKQKKSWTNSDNCGSEDGTKRSTEMSDQQNSRAAKRYEGNGFWTSEDIHVKDSTNYDRVRYNGVELLVKKRPSYVYADQSSIFSKHQKTPKQKKKKMSNQSKAQAPFGYSDLASMIAWDTKSSLADKVHFATTLPPRRHHIATTLPPRRHIVTWRNRFFAPQYTTTTRPKRFISKFIDQVRKPDPEMTTLAPYYKRKDMEKKETDRNNRRKDKRQSKKRNKCLDKRTPFNDATVEGLPMQDFPWMVGILSSDRLLCSGVVIHEHYVLSSASCALDSTIHKVPYIQQLDVKTSIRRIVLHHAWDRTLGLNDLVLLETVFPLTSDLCLPQGIETATSLFLAGHMNSNLRQSVNTVYRQNITSAVQSNLIQDFLLGGGGLIERSRAGLYLAALRGATFKGLQADPALVKMTSSIVSWISSVIDKHVVEQNIQ